MHNVCAPVHRGGDFLNKMDLYCFGYWHFILVYVIRNIIFSVVKECIFIRF